jgi:tetratricopeptide (TPR) repeat protein
MAIERSGEAKKHFEKGKKLYNEGYNEGNYGKAILEFSEVIKLLPNDAESYSGRGDCYLVEGQLDEALADFSKAISLDPNNGELYRTRSAIYLRVDEIEKSKADLEKTVELIPDKARVPILYYSFGLDLERLTGDKDEAIVYLKKAVELGGEYGALAKKKLAEWGM